MAFNTNSLGQAYTRLLITAADNKTKSAKASTDLAAGNVSANAVLSIMSNAKTFIEELTEIAAMPGIGQFAKDQSFNQSYDVVAEFNAMKAAAEAVRDEIINVFPTSTNGYLEKDTIMSDGSIDVRQFSPAATAGLRTLLDALVASIGS